MLKAFVIIIAVVIAAVNLSAQTVGSGKRGVGGKLLLKRPAVVRIGPSTTYLKAGLSSEEVVRLLGEPANVTERTEGGVKIATYEFTRSENRVFVAHFINDALVASQTENRIPTAEVGM